MTNIAHEQAAVQLESIREMVAALDCDYDRIEELRELREGFDDVWPETYENEVQELAELEEAAGDCEDYEDARQRIEEDALCVEVRSGWVPAGSEEIEPEEYRIVLCTGGPHVEIVGDLNSYREPATARLFYQNWFEGKQEYHATSEDEAAMLAYAGVFYFGS